MAKKDTVMLFTGQGSQYEGMGLVFKNLAIAKKYWRAANLILKRDIRAVSFYGSHKEIKKTNNCQLLLYINEYISSKLVIKNKLIAKPKLTGGFSLGEVNAYICSGTTNFINGLLIINRRCFLMHMCCTKYLGAMLAILKKEAGFNWGGTLILCRKLKLQISNVNAKEQVVVSGCLYTINIFKKILTSSLVNLKLNYRVIFLKVNGGYHSSLMNYASLGIFKFISKFKTFSSKRYVFNNMSGSVFVKYSLRGDLCFNIAKQVVKTVNLYKNVIGLLKIKGLLFVELNKLGTVSNIVKAAALKKNKNMFVLLNESSIYCQLNTLCGS